MDNESAISFPHLRIPNSEVSESDELGNRTFSFPNQTYEDRQQRQIFASLLISTEGRKVIKEKKGFLQDLNYAIQEVCYPKELPGLIEQRDQATIVDSSYIELCNKINSLQDKWRYTQDHPYQIFNSDRTLYYLAKGGESDVYIYQDGNEKYIIKYHVEAHPTLENLSQPYVNEMLQFQYLIRDLSEPLSALGIFFPNLYFASSDLSCSQFIEGRTPNSEELSLNKINQIYTLLAEYIKARQAEDQTGLWTALYPDVYKNESGIRYDNFKITDDGKIYLIDPFVYLEKNTERGKPPLSMTRTAFIPVKRPKK